MLSKTKWNHSKTNFNRKTKINSSDSSTSRTTQAPLNAVAKCKWHPVLEAIITVTPISSFVNQKKRKKWWFRLKTRRQYLWKTKPHSAAWSKSRGKTIRKLRLSSKRMVAITALTTTSLSWQRETLWILTKTITKQPTTWITSLQNWTSRSMISRKQTITTKTMKTYCCRKTETRPWRRNRFASRWSNWKISNSRLMNKVSRRT